MSGGYATLGNKSKNIAWSKNVSLSNINNTLQDLLTIDILAGYFIRDGQALICDFFGNYSNVGNSNIFVQFDGTPCSYNTSISASLGVDSFHIKCIITAMNKTGDNFWMAGKSTFANTDVTPGNTRTFILDSQFGGNAIPDAHQLKFSCEGNSGTLFCTLNSVLITLIDGFGEPSNLYP